MNQKKQSAESPGLSLGLKKSENVTFPNGSLDVPHDEPVLVVQKLDPHLSHLTTRPCTAHHLHHQCVLNCCVHVCQKNKNWSVEFTFQGAIRVKIEIFCELMR